MISDSWKIKTSSGQNILSENLLLLSSYIAVEFVSSLCNSCGFWNGCFTKESECKEEYQVLVIRDAKLVFSLKEGCTEQIVKISHIWCSTPSLSCAPAVALPQAISLGVSAVGLQGWQRGKDWPKQICRSPSDRWVWPVPSEPSYECEFMFISQKQLEFLL